VEQEIVAVGGDLEPATLIGAYSEGLFPMPVGRHLGWFSPDPRAVIPLGGLHVSRSLRRSLAGFEIRIDTAFEEVMRACGDPPRPHGWINEAFVDAYTRLHELGWAHSVEAWKEGELVGGVYGVRIGAFFAGESMFHRVTNASKVALAALVDHLNEREFRLFDIQFVTQHTGRMGAIEIPRDDYLDRLRDAISLDVRFA